VTPEKVLSEYNEDLIFLIFENYFIKLFHGYTYKSCPRGQGSGVAGIVNERIEGGAPRR